MARKHEEIAPEAQNETPAAQQPNPDMEELKATMKGLCEGVGSLAATVGGMKTAMEQMKQEVTQVKTKVEEEPPAPEVTLENQVLASNGLHYRVTVTYGPDAGIPQDAVLTVQEVFTGSDQHAECVKKTAKTLKRAVTYARFFDIGIYKDGQKVELEAPVDVKIELLDSALTPKARQNMQVVHFGADTEAVDAHVHGEQITFEARGFSIYGVVTTEEDDEEYATILVNALEKDKEHHIVLIGRQGENKTQDVVFDCSVWDDRITNPTYSIVAKRPGEKETYLANNVSADGNIVTWTLDADDTALSGFGEAEIRATSDDLVKKSAKFRTYIQPSVEDYTSSDPVTPPYWGTAILTAVQESAASAAAAEAAAQHMDETGVRFSEDQTLTEEQKAQGRENIGAAADADLEKAKTLQLLHDAEIAGTTQKVTFDGDTVEKIEHVDGEENVVRTDTFVITAAQIVETRTLATGETLTLTTNLSTLDTAVVLTTD